MMKNIGMVLLLASCILVSSSPSIQTNGQNLQLRVDIGADIQVAVGSTKPQSLITALTDISSLTQMQLSLETQAKAINASLLKSVSDLTSLIVEADHSVAIADLSAAVKANAKALTEYSTLTQAVIDNVTQAQQKLAILEANTTASAVATSKKNPNCLADLLLETPINIDAIKGSCSLATDGVCTIGCKPGFEASTDVNVALHGVVATSMPDAEASKNKAFDGDTRAINSNRLVGACRNQLCAVGVDLGQNQTGITQFRFSDGHSSCTPEMMIKGTCVTSVLQFIYCKHKVQVWRGDTFVSIDEAVDPTNSDDWLTVVDFPKPSLMGEEHPAVHGVWAQYVRLLVDNRVSATCVNSPRYFRIYEFEVLKGSTQDYKCTADGLTRMDQSVEPLLCYERGYNITDAP